eukprot:CAMPEP_0197574888 /NCGR_PEP_ID=MMETSP1326-20131121/474_1 /TAXON_ID=1155430 /ORGANISM="Genus nov. species nov., Strain RCC2288" /LENGTH=1092 /DNA_ID=CAMNT_0043137551 /DNA_START=191 /DNA_END=3466 /DNA_ORIENTATION=+
MPSESLDGELLKALLDESSLPRAVRGVANNLVELLLQTLSKIPSQDLKFSPPPHFHSALGSAAKTVKFSAPDRVYLVGSAVSGACLKTSPGTGFAVVDVAVEMPKGYFQEKDYLDHRYHAKRLAYLEVLQQHVHRAGWVASVALSAHHADIRKPCLLIRPKKPSGDVCLRLLLTARANAFPASRLLPDKANLRQLEAAGGGDGGNDRLASPHYNQSILEDMFLDEHIKFLRDAAQKAEFLEEACVLLKVWASRRGLLSAPDGFTGFVLSMLMAHLVSTGSKLSPLMDALQLVKCALTLLSNPAMSSGGFWASGAQPQNNMGAWRSAFPFVFVGPCGFVNIGARVSKSAVAEFVHEAALSAAVLERGGRTAFEQVFLVSLHPAARYDVHLHVTVDRNGNSASGNCDTDMVSWRGHEAQASDVVTNALGARAKLIRVQHQPFVNSSDVRQSHQDLVVPLPTKKRKSTEQHDAEEESDDMFTLWIGIILDPENAFRLVDLGPSSDDEKLAKQFRAFWGDRAELRRFKDGRICESVVWDSVPSSQRHHIPALAVEYAVKRNFAAAESVGWSCSLLDPALGVTGKEEDSYKESSPIALIQCLDRLAKRMKEMKDVPLKVINVQPLSAAFRGTDPFPPRPHQLAFGAGIGLGRSNEHMPVCPRTLEVLVQLEGSGRWPENSAAINKTKAAMALKIAEQLRSSYATPTVVSEEAIDVLHEGYAIRLHINSTAGGANNEAAEKHLIKGAAHSGVIATVSARFPAYGPATQVAKRWISAHMLSSHMGDEVIELLVGYLFLHPGAAEPPTSREVAFFRFLDLLASHPWGVLPLFVDPEDEVTLESMHELEKKMDDPDAPAMCISTPYDSSGDLWTRRGPFAVVLKRAQALASRAAERLKVLLQGCNRMASAKPDIDGVKLGDESAWESLFTPALMHYDIVLKLRRAALPFPEHALFTGKQIKRRLVKELGVDSDTFQMAEHGSKRGLKLARMPEKVLTRGPDKARAAMLIGFDPLQCFLREAERRLGGTALIFSDKHGGDLIGVALKPKLAHHRAQLPASLGDFDPLGDFNPPAPPGVDEILDELLYVGNGFIQDAYKGAKW